MEGDFYRIIPSRFPPINFFEKFTPVHLMDEAFEIESLTNDRLRESVGELQRVPFEDRVSGPGATIAMAPFTHIGNASRFTDGSYGVYYAASDLHTAILETLFHRERFFRTTQEPSCEVDMRAFLCQVLYPLVDLRTGEFQHLLDPEPLRYPHSQQFAAERRAEKRWGLAYPSVRNPEGDCIAVFRPNAITAPTQGAHLSYHWNGKHIEAVYEKKALLVKFDRQRELELI